MVVEIRFDGSNVKVRRFGMGRPMNWLVIPPGEVDVTLTHFSHERLRELGEGIWDIPQEVGAA